MSSSAAELHSASVVVIDASALVDTLLLGRLWPLVVRGRLNAPSVLDYEFVHVMRRASRTPAIGASRARESLEVFAALQIVRHPAGPLLSRMWQLRHNVSAYDASYIALAEGLGVPLVTSDLRLARAAEQWCDVLVPDEA